MNAFNRRVTYITFITGLSVLLGIANSSAEVTHMTSNPMVGRALKSIDTYSKDPRNATWEAAHNALNLLSSEKEEARKAFAKVLYQNAMRAIANYSHAPQTARREVELLKSFNDIQVGAVNPIGVYDDAVTRLIQTARKNLEATHKISSISNTSTVAADSGRVFTASLGRINEQKWNAKTQQWEIVSTIESPRDADRSFGEDMQVHGDILVVFSKLKFFIYALDHSSNKWLLSDVIALNGLIDGLNARSAIRWAFSYTDIPGFKGEVAESIAVVADGKFYMLDQQISFKEGKSRAVWQLNRTLNFGPAVVKSVAADGSFAVISDEGGVDGMARLHVLRSKVIVNTVNRVTRVSKSWAEDKLVETNKKSVDISLAIDEEFYPSDNSNTLSHKVTIVYGFSEDSGNVYTLRGSISTSDDKIFWSGPDPIGLVVPFIEKAGQVKIVLKNHQLVIGVSSGVVLVYQFDDLKWVWDYALDHNPGLEKSSSFGYTMATDADTVGVGNKAKDEALLISTKS